MTSATTRCAATPATTGSTAARGTIASWAAPVTTRSRWPSAATRSTARRARTRYEIDFFELGPTVTSRRYRRRRNRLARAQRLRGRHRRAWPDHPRGDAHRDLGNRALPLRLCRRRPPPPPPPPAAKPACIVPKLRGRTLARARVLLARARCSLGKVTRVRSRVKRGVVLRQSPVAGSRRARGAKVSLRVSRGP